MKDWKALFFSGAFGIEPIGPCTIDIESNFQILEQLCVGCVQIVLVVFDCVLNFWCFPEYVFWGHLWTFVSHIITCTCFVVFTHPRLAHHLNNNACPLGHHCWGWKCDVPTAGQPFRRLRCLVATWLIPLCIETKSSPCLLVSGPSLYVDIPCR